MFGIFSINNNDWLITTINVMFNCRFIIEILSYFINLFTVIWLKFHCSNIINIDYQQQQQQKSNNRLNRKKFHLISLSLFIISFVFINQNINNVESLILDNFSTTINKIDFVEKSMENTNNDNDIIENSDSSISQPDLSGNNIDDDNDDDDENSMANNDFILNNDEVSDAELKDKHILKYTEKYTLERKKNTEFFRLQRKYRIFLNRIFLFGNFLSITLNSFIFL